jgi:hypothetical protein
MSRLHWGSMKIQYFLLPDMYTEQVWFSLLCYLSEHYNSHSLLYLIHHLSFGLTVSYVSFEKFPVNFVQEYKVHM